MRPLSEVSVRRLLVIILVPVVLASLAAGWHPTQLIPPEGEVTLRQVTNKDNLLWLDVRSEEDYATGHVRHALWLTPEVWDTRLPVLLQMWQPGDQVIVYCSSSKCETSREVAQRLREEVGLVHAYYLKGGWEVILRSEVQIQVGVKP